MLDLFANFPVRIKNARGAYGDPDEDSRYKLFKIKYLGLGQYSIRSMLKSDMGWTNVNNELVITTIGTSDTAIPNSAKWTINSNTNGYAFFNSGKAVTSFEDVCEDLYLGTSSLSNMLQRWDMTEIEVTSAYNGVVIYNSVSSLAVGEQVTFNAGVYSIYTDVNGQHPITWSVTNGTGSATIDSSTGVLTAQSTGTVTVMAICSYLNKSVTYQIRVIAVSEGIYVIGHNVLNGATDFVYYIQTNETTIPDETFIVAGTFDGDENQKWEISHIGNGYYKIISVLTGKALTLTPTASNAVTQLNYTGSTYQQWSIVRQASGIQMLPAIDTSMNITIRDDNVIAASESVYTWDFVRAVQDGSDIYCLGINNPTHDHHTVFGEILPDIVSDPEYKTFNCSIVDSITLPNALRHMANSKIFISRSHGDSYTNSTYIGIGNDGKLGSFNIYNFEDQEAKIDLSNCDLIVFMACKTGNHETQSLAHAAVAAGAKCSIAFKKNIDCEDANEWLKKFFDALMEGMSVEEAVNAASDGLETNTNGLRVEDILVVGDISFGGAT